MAEKLHGQQPRPRALILGLDEKGFAEVAPFFPTHRVVKPETLDRGEIRQREYDCLLIATEAPFPNVEDHLFVIAFGCPYLGAPEEKDREWPQATLTRFRLSYASEFKAADGTSEEIKRLIEVSLLPAALQRTPHRAIAFGMNPQTIKAGIPSCVRPFLVDGDGQIVAGYFSRHGGKAECWSLPEYADKAKWVRLALSDFRKRSPERFPESDPWWKRAEWRTAEEAKAFSAQKELAEERKKLIADLELREAEAEQRIATTEAAAAQNQRLLLTAQGPDLVDVVAAVLRDFGFTVEKMDDVWPENLRREDLRLRIPEDLEWEALAEVKGYTHGAKLNDFLKLSRFHQLYYKEKSKDPSSSWYICNQFADQDPALREGILRGHPEEVAQFVNDFQAVLIDTVDLFRLWRDLQEGRRTATEIRALLVGLRGALPAPPVQLSSSSPTRVEGS